MATSFTKRQLRRRMSRLVTKWRRIMMLEDWDIDIFFDHDVATEEAKIIAWPHYEEATIAFNLDKIYAELFDNFRGVEEVVVHELAHCIVGATGTRENERQTTHVARSILRAYHREK